MQSVFISILCLLLTFPLFSRAYVAEYKKLDARVGIKTKYFRPCRKYYSTKIEALWCLQNQLKTQKKKTKRALELLGLKDYYQHTDNTEAMASISKAYSLSSNSSVDSKKIEHFCADYISTFPVSYSYCLVSIIEKLNN